MRESKTLYKEALKLGLCEEYTNNWQGDNVESLCKMYKDGIHFCIDKGYPDVDFMAAKFRGKTEVYGIYIRERFSIVAEHDLYIFDGGSDGILTNNEFGVTKAYVRRDSFLELRARGNSITYIDLFDGCDLVLSIKDDAKVIINNYGGTIIGSNGLARIKTHK